MVTHQLSCLQLIVLEDKLENLNRSNDEEVAEGKGKVEALGQLNKQLRGLRASQDLLKGLLANLVVRNSGFQAKTINGGVTGIIFGGGGNSYFSMTKGGGDGNSGFQAGTINGGVSGLILGNSSY